MEERGGHLLGAVSFCSPNGRIFKGVGDKTEIVLGAVGYQLGWCMILYAEDEIVRELLQLIQVPVDVVITITAMKVPLFK